MRALAGIKDKVAGAIVINGGDILADSYKGAGIGGGFGKDSGYTSIEINGGKVAARGGKDQPAAGIGPERENKTIGRITITGGSVDAQGARGQAAIGANASGSVVITGGRVEAQSQNTATIEALGGNGIAGQTVTINADTAVEGDYVKAIGNNDGNGIYGNKITISGGNVDASVD